MAQWGYGMQWLLARMTYIMQVIRGGSIHFDHIIAVNGGGIHVLNSAGMTTVTDAGGAGLFTAYNSTTNRWGWGTAAPAYSYDFQTAAGEGFRAVWSAGNLTLYYGDMILTTTGGLVPFNWSMTGNQTGLGWVLPKGVIVDLGHDFNFDDWAAIGAAAGYQMQGSIVAQIALRDNVRGGIARIWSVNAAAPNWLEVSGRVHTWSAQDEYRVYTRFCDQQIADIKSWVGVSDGPAGVNPYGAVAGNGLGIVQDDAVGPFWLLRQVRASAVVDDSSGTMAVAGAFHQYDLIVTAAGVPTLYYDGVIIAVGAAIDSPLPTTMLEPVLWVNNIAAAVLAQLDVDCYKIVQSRNTAVTP